MMTDGFPDLLQVQLGVWDLPVLQVQVSKETWGTKGWQERRDHLVVAETLVLQAWWSVRPCINTKI